jgi:hypothetical protein
MASFSDLPPEIIKEILILAYLDQSTPISLDNFRWSDRKNPLIYERAKVITAYSLSKLVTKSFARQMQTVQDCRGNDAYFYYGLYETFVTHRIKRDALLSLSRTCCRLNEIARPMLWEIVELRLGCEKTEAVVDLVKFLAKRPGIGESIKALAFRSSERKSSGKKSNVPYNARYRRLSLRSIMEDQKELGGLDEAKNLIKKDRGNPLTDGQIDDAVVSWSSTKQMAFLLSQMPCLLSLKIILADIPDFWNALNPSIYSSNTPSAFQNLKEVSLVGDDSDGHIFDAFSLVTLFHLPNISTLYFGRIIAAGDSKDRPSDFAKFKGTSKVKNLTFDYALIEAVPLEVLISLPSALESFDVSFFNRSNLDSRACEGATMREYYHALLPQRASLKIINIRGIRDARQIPIFGNDEMGTSEAGIIKQFTVLEDLSIPVMLLLPSRFSYLEEVLPFGLVRLKLYAYDEILLQDLGRLLRHFFDKKHLLAPRLKNLWVEYWSSVELQQECWRSIKAIERDI